MNKQPNARIENFFTSIKCWIDLKWLTVILVVSMYCFIFVAYGSQIFEYLIYKNDYLKLWKIMGFPNDKIDSAIDFYINELYYHLAVLVIKVFALIFLVRFITIANGFSSFRKYIENSISLMISTYICFLAYIDTILWLLYTYPMESLLFMRNLHFASTFCKYKFTRIEKTLYGVFILIITYNVCSFLGIINDWPQKFSMLPIKEYAKGSFLLDIYNLCKKTEINPDKILIANEEKALGAFTVKNLGRSFIFVFSKLYHTFPENMIIGLLAHEIGHYKDTFLYFKDIFSFIQMGFGFSIFVLIYRRYNRKLGDLITLVYLSIILDSFNFWFGIMNKYISRSCEYRADNYVLSIGYGNDFCDALSRLTEETPFDFDLNLIVEIFRTHPSTMNRIKNIRK